MKIIWYNGKTARVKPKTILLISLILLLMLSFSSQADFADIELGIVNQELVMQKGNKSVNLSIIAVIAGEDKDVTDKFDWWKEDRGDYWKFGANITIPDTAQGEYIADNLEEIKFVGRSNVNLKNLKRMYKTGFHFSDVSYEDNISITETVVDFDFRDIIDQYKHLNVPISKQWDTSQDINYFNVSFDVTSVNFHRGQVIELDPTIEVTNTTTFKTEDLLDCLLKSSENSYNPDRIGNSRAGYILSCRDHNHTSNFGRRGGDPSRSVIITIPKTHWNDTWLEPEYYPFDIETNNSPDIITQRKYYIPIDKILRTTEKTALHNIEYNTLSDWQIRKNITNVASLVEEVNWDNMPEPIVLHGSAGTTTICTGGGCDYETLKLWEDGEDGHTTDAPTIANITGAFEDTDIVTIDGWYSNSTAYIQIVVDESVRHNGAWDETAYRLVANSGYFGLLYIRDKDVYIDGIQLKSTNRGTSGNDHAIFPAAGSGNLNVSNSILTVSGNRTTGHAIDLGNIDDGKFTANVWNNIMYGFPEIAMQNSFQHDGHTYNLHSNTIYNISKGGIKFTEFSYNLNLSIKNNLIFNTTDDYDIGNFDYETITNNLGEDADGFDNHVQTSQTCSQMFTNCNDDFHLLSGSDAVDAGADLSAAGNNCSFTDDIDGETRTGSWDIGADEYVSAEDVTPPVISIDASSDENVTLTDRNDTYIKVTIDEAVDNCTLNWNYSTNYSMWEIDTQTFDYNITDSTNGTYDWYVACNDTSGNIGESSWAWTNITYIHTPPAVDSCTPTANTDWTITDNCTKSEFDWNMSDHTIHIDDGRLILTNSSNLTLHDINITKDVKDILLNISQDSNFNVNKT